MAEIIIPAGYMNVEFWLSSPYLNKGISIWSTGVGDTAFDPGTSLSDLEDSWTEHIAPLTDSGVALVNLSAYTATLRYDRATSVNGEATYSLPPPNTTALVRKETSARGPRARARFQPYGHLDEAAIDEAGTINPTNRQDLQSAYAALRDDVMAAFGSTVILARTGGASPPPAAPYAVSDWSVQAKVSTQRRRLR